MNEYQQALMSGQFSPGQYMTQRRQGQNFMPMQPLTPPPITEMDQNGGGQQFGGVQSLLDKLKKKQMEPVADQGLNLGQQWGTPVEGAGVAPDKMAGNMDWLKMLQQGAQLFGG